MTSSNVIFHPNKWKVNENSISFYRRKKKGKKKGNLRGFYVFVVVSFVLFTLHAPNKT